ncbi:MAG: 1-acyl-sn-glycerol-3-phosphate acyltransferase [Bacteroidetes bacterium]|nr:1-acyl-sn-glycerol-3-phosphate acyltransferase [Bacteroidota bacterium]MBL6944441.1 1-acyl-sn-glycerol-3-phosphate acyltransferase [Bacteroidales bacterium]
MSKTKNSLASILNKASELYNNDQFSQTSKYLSKSQSKTIYKELKDIAANKKSKLILLTKILKPLILPTAKRTTLESKLKLSQLSFKKNIIIYMPNHKSHLDEFILGFTFVNEKIPVPITAAGENLFKNRTSNFVLKSYGAFKIRRDKYSVDEHYYRLLSSYLGASIMAGEQIMSFQEGTRPRDGKIGLFRKGIIGTIEKLFNDMKDNPELEIEDITFVPIAINWSENPDEKKITADVSSKAEETDLISRFINFKKTHSSKDIRGVFIGIGEPVSYNQYVAGNNPDENDSYAIGICNEVRSRVVGMMPIFKEHLLYSSIQFLNKYNKHVKIEDFNQLLEVTLKIISDYEDNIKVIETDGFSVESRLDLMEKRDIIKFSKDKLSFEVLNPNLVEYYANHVTSLTEDRET